MDIKIRSVVASALAVILTAASCLVPAAAEENLPVKVDLPAGFQFASEFCMGSAYVYKGDEIGLVDSDGNYKKLGNYTFYFVENECFSTGTPFLTLFDGNYENPGFTYLAKDGMVYDEVYSCWFEYADSMPQSSDQFFDDYICIKDDRYGLLDCYGKPLIPCEYALIFMPVTEGLTPVCKEAGPDEYRWGYLNRLGEEVIPFQYAVASGFSEGLAAVYDGEKYGYIDTAGNWVIPPVYDDAGDFHNGCAYIAQGESYNIIDKSQNFLLDEPCDRIYYTDSTEGIVCEYFQLFDQETGLRGIFSTKQRKVIAEPRYDLVENYGGDSLIASRHLPDDTILQGLVTVDGTEAVPCEYEEIVYLGENLYRLCGEGEPDGSLTKIVGPDGSGKTSMAFDDIGTFSDGLAWFCQNGECGYIDPQGTVVLEPIYEEARDFSNGRAVVSKDGKRGLIDKTGAVIIPCEYDSLKVLPDGYIWALDYGDGSADPEMLVSFDPAGKKLSSDTLVTSAWMGEGMMAVSESPFLVRDSYDILLSNVELYRQSYGEPAMAIRAADDLIAALPDLPAPYTEEQKAAAQSAVEAAASAYGNLNYAEQQIVRNIDRLILAEARVALEHPIWGDASGDGGVTAMDIMSLRKFLIAGTGLDTEHQVLADLSGDYQLTALDIMQLRKLMLAEA